MTTPQSLYGVVLDASVVVKLLVNEEWSDETNTLLEPILYPPCPVRIHFSQAWLIMI